RPVTDKYVSVTGCVKSPCSFWAPLGTPYRDLIARAGGATVQECAILISGILMGKITFDPDEVVTKTCAGIILLPRDHSLIRRKTKTSPERKKIGKSACDQCSYCTEFCPRYLLGYEVQPHKVMRGLGFSPTGAPQHNQWAELCCSCGLCTLYACPEDLYPREHCDEAKADMRRAGIKFTQTAPVRVHPMKESRRVPLKLLRKRLKVEEFESDAPHQPEACQPERVLLKLSQHVGKPARPVVSAGDRVNRADCVARVAAEDLGVDLHASVNGTITRVTEDFIEIQRG
ncbi:MAG: 4Fe-4S dicluster domain-containing protein, partial [Candidatus Eremiobacterota bacterium]